MKRSVTFITRYAGPCVGIALFFFSYAVVSAATLSISPGTGVYTSNSSFTVRVSVNSSGQSINAAEGTLSFNPNELSVVNVNRSGSIFNLWVTEPSFSNSAGTISFSGGLPSGYTGSNGTIMSVTLRAKGSGATKLNFSTGSVLANDGRGTNVLTTMNGGSFTIQAAAPTPEPESVIVEYVAPANTPSAPVITSSTHSDPDQWYTAREAVLMWNIPAGVTAVRTLLDTRQTSVPTKVYESPINSITLPDLPEGESYFHLQFKNENGWGKVANYRLAVDSEKPTAITISQPSTLDKNNPEQELIVEVEDVTSDVRRFNVQIDDAEAFELIKKTASSTVQLPVLTPGYHTIVIEAFDEAGNSVIGTYTLTIEAFEKPIFIEYPPEISEEVIPVIKGTTRPKATVTVTLTRSGAQSTSYEVTSDETGSFTFIPDGRFTSGVYEITARARDSYGATSLESDPIKIAVQKPGFIRIGSLLVSFFSVLIPLIGLTGLAIVGSWYMIMYLRRFRKQIRKESDEALQILHREFSALQQELRVQEALIIEARKTKKLSKAEADMIEAFDRALQKSQRAVEKEIVDVTRLTNSNE